MNEPLKDKQVIVIILATLLLVFILIFSTVKTQHDFDDSIQWKDGIYESEYTVKT